MIVFTANPKLVQQNGQFASDSYNRSFLRSFSAALRHTQTPSPQMTIFAEWAQDVLGTTDQQTPQILIAGLRDPSLWVCIAGLVSSRYLSFAQNNGKMLLGE